MSSMAKRMFLLGALGSAGAVTPSHAAGQHQEHAGVHPRSGPAPHAAVPHAKVESTSQQGPTKAANVIVEKFAKMPVIGNGLVTTNPVIQKVSSKSDVVATEKLAKTPVMGKESAKVSPAAAKSEHASAKPLALGKVAAEVSTFVNGTHGAAKVWCGGEYAADCADCPKGNGATWCHGHCQWTGSQCILQGQPPAAKDLASSIHQAPQAVSSKKATSLSNQTKLSHVATGTAVGKLPWVHKDLPVKPVAAIHHTKATKIVSHNAQDSKSAVGHFLSHSKKEDECTCAFHGVCTCEASMAFMECISKSCDAGCECHDMQYKDACHNLQSACGDMGLTFDCSGSQATCVAHEHTFTTKPPPRVHKTITHARPLPHLDAPKHTDDVSFMYHSLLEMKEDKCQLEAAVKDGFVNADDRLGLLIPQIEDALGNLELQCLKIPELRCDKDFEEYSGYPEGHRCGPKPTPKPKSGSSSTHLALAVVAIIAAHVAHP